MLVVLVTPSVSPDCQAVLRGLFALPGVQTGLICHTQGEHIPDDLRRRLAGHYKVDNVGDVEAVATGVTAFQRGLGKVDRLIGFAEVLQVQLAVLRERFGIAGVLPDVAQRFRDKNTMKDVLRRNGLPVAKQARLQSSEDAWAFVRDVGFPIVLKPLAGVGSQGTVRVNDVGELKAALEQHQPGPHRHVQAEAWITGPERTFETVLVGGEPVWSSQTFYLDRPLDILENAWKQWTVLFPREVHDDASRAFLPTDVAAIRALGLHTGIAHLEWFLTANGPVIGEVGARPPGARFMTMLGYSYDDDLWSRWAELEVLGRWRPLPERKYAVGCAFFRAQGRGSHIVGIEGLDRAQALVGGLVMDVQLPRIGARARGSYEGDGYAVVRHPDTAVVKDALHKLVSNVRVWLG
jgi:hypothetical protein